MHPGIPDTLIRRLSNNRGSGRQGQLFFHLSLGVFWAFILLRVSDAKGGEIPRDLADERLDVAVARNPIPLAPLH